MTFALPSHIPFRQWVSSPLSFPNPETELSSQHWVGQSWTLHMTPWSISFIVTSASLYIPALFPSQFPSYKVERQYFPFLSLSSTPIAGPILPQHNCYLSSPPVTLSSNFLSHISDSFQVQAVLCILCFPTLNSVVLYRNSQAWDVQKDSKCLSSCLLLCVRTLSSVTLKTISPISNPNFECWLQVA